MMWIRVWWCLNVIMFLTCFLMISNLWKVLRIHTCSAICNNFAHGSKWCITIAFLDSASSNCASVLHAPNVLPDHSFLIYWNIPKRFKFWVRAWHEGTNLAPRHEVQVHSLLPNIERFQTIMQGMSCERMSKHTSDIAFWTIWRHQWWTTYTTSSPTWILTKDKSVRKYETL